MPRVTKGARLAVGAALAVSALCVAAFIRVATIPPVANALGPHETFKRLLVVSTPDRVIVLDDRDHYDVSTDLSVADGHHFFDVIQSIQSVAWNRGALAVLCNFDHALRFGGNAAEHSGLLVIRDGKTELRPVPKRPLAVRAAGEDFEVFSFGEYQLVSSLQGPVTIARNIKKLDAIEAIHFVDEKPLFVVGERGAHWLVDEDGSVQKMPGGASNIWSASALKSPTVRAAYPFVDSHGQPRALASALPYHAFAVDEQGELQALDVAPGADETGVLATSWQGNRVELKVKQRRLLAASASKLALAPVASLPVGAPYVAFPVGDRFLALDEAGRTAVLLDAHGQRLLAPGGMTTIAAMTGLSPGVWILLILSLATGSFALIALALRARRTLADADAPPARADKPGAAGLFVGTLEVPAGSMLSSTANAAACKLRSSGVSVELQANPRRLDGSTAPLVDGDQVYVFGELEHEGKGGPFRNADRRTLGPAPGGRRYFVGLGGAADFVRHLIAHESARLTAVALAQLTFGLVILGCLALRPFL